MSLSEQRESTITGAFRSLERRLYFGWRQARHYVERALGRSANGSETHGQSLTTSDDSCNGNGAHNGNGRSNGRGNGHGRNGHDRLARGYVEKILENQPLRRYVLLNPGPVLTTPEVKSALVQYDVCHRDMDYSDILEEIERKLLRVFRAPEDEYSALLLTGSGTAATESAISSVVPHGRKILVISNGAFGDRLKEIADTHRIPVVLVRHPWGEPIDVEAVRRAMVSDPAIFAVVMVHHETSVGILNPIREVGELAHQYGLLYIVDAIASLGGEELDVVRDHIDICISCGNKCLHAISGVSFLCVRDGVWKAIEGVRPRVYYLDMNKYRDYARQIRQTPFTPSVATFFALDRALTELLEEGLDARIARYRELNALMRQGLTRLGLEIVNDTPSTSHSVCCVRTPETVSFSDLYEGLKNQGFIMYNSKAHLADRVFQVANMGALSNRMVYEFLFELEAWLKRHRETTSRSTGPKPSGLASVRPSV